MSKKEIKVEETGVAKVEEKKETGVAMGSQYESMQVDINNIPDLEKAEVLPLDMIQKYWTPTLEDVGIKRRVIFINIEPRMLMNPRTKEKSLADCAIFALPVTNKETGEISVEMFSNASTLLVATLRDLNVQSNTAIILVYKGKKATKNGNQMDNWSIFYIINRK